MKKKIFAIVLIVTLLFTGFGLNPVSGIKNVNRNITNNERPLLLTNSDLSVDLKVRKSETNSWTDSLSSVKVNDRLEFKIAINSAEGNMCVAIEFPYVDEYVMFSYVVGSASVGKLTDGSLIVLKEAIIWLFVDVPPSDITFEATVKKAGDNKYVNVFAGSTESSDLVVEDSVKISASGKSRVLFSFPYSFLLNLIQFFKLYKLPLFCLYH